MNLEGPNGFRGFSRTRLLSTGTCTDRVDSDPGMDFLV